MGKPGGRQNYPHSQLICLIPSPYWSPGCMLEIYYTVTIESLVMIKQWFVKFLLALFVNTNLWHFPWSLNNVEVYLFYLFFFPLAFFTFVVDSDLSLLIGDLFEIVPSSWLELDQQLKITLRLFQSCCSSLEQIILVPLARGNVQPGLGGWRCSIAHIPIS